MVKLKVIHMDQLLNLNMFYWSHVKGKEIKITFDDWIFKQDEELQLIELQ